MKITRHKDKFIVELQATTSRFNPYDESENEKMDTIIGLITKTPHGHEEMGLAHRIDMSYKGKEDQVGSFIVLWTGEKKDFIKECNKNKIDIAIY